jgi:hypothetical protein
VGRFALLASVSVVELDVAAVASVVLTLFAITKVVVAIQKAQMKKARAKAGYVTIAEGFTAG